MKTNLIKHVIISFIPMRTVLEIIESVFNIERSFAIDWMEVLLCNRLWYTWHVILTKLDYFHHHESKPNHIYFAFVIEV